MSDSFVVVSSLKKNYGGGGNQSQVIADRPDEVFSPSHRVAPAYFKFSLTHLPIRSSSFIFVITPQGAFLLSSSPFSRDQ